MYHGYGGCEYNIVMHNILYTVKEIIYLLYVLKLLIIARATSCKTPNMGKNEAKSHQLAEPPAGHKQSRKVAIFSKVKEKGLT